MLHQNIYSVFNVGVPAAVAVTLFDVTYIIIDKLASNLKIWEELAYPLIAISQNSGMEDQNLCEQAWEIIHAVRKNCEQVLSNTQKDSDDKIKYALKLESIVSISSS